MTLERSSENVKLPEAFLFDLDATLIVNELGYEGVWLQVCERHASALGIESERLHAEIMAVSHSYWRDPERHRVQRLRILQSRREVVHLAGERLGLGNPSGLTRVADDYHTTKERGGKLSPGTLELLAWLRGSGVQLGLVTNGASEPQRAKIDQFELAPLFDTVLVEGEFGLGKPDERVYREILGRLGAEPENSWIVGDNLEWEVATPQRLGIFAIWHDFNRRGLPADTSVSPDRIVHSMSDVLSWCLELGGLG